MSRGRRQFPPYTKPLWKRAPASRGPPEQRVRLSRSPAEPPFTALLHGHERVMASPRLQRAARRVVRVWMPLLIALIGVALMLLPSSESALGAGIVLVGVAALVVLLNALVRVGLQSNRERDREEWARRYFSHHGRWPHPR
jgi:hypothetical protein